MIARKIPAGHRLSDAPESVPGGHPVPTPDLDPVAVKIEALAAPLADVVELTRSSAVYPGHFAAIAEQAQNHESVRRALRVSGQ